MGYVVVLIIGMILLAVGVQGGIRILLDANDPGILGWIAAGPVVQLAGYIVAAAVGVGLAWWGRAQAKRRGHLK